MTMMTNSEYKRKLFNNTFRQILLCYFIRGIKSTVRSIPKITSVFMIVAVFVVTLFQQNNNHKTETIFVGLNKLTQFSSIFLIIVLFASAFIIMMILFGKPKCARRYHNDFHRCGMVNSAGESPALIERTKRRNSRIEKLVFFSKGLPLSLWNDNKEKIESSLNLSIDSIEQGRDKHHFVVYAIDGCYVLPERIDWNPALISNKNSVLVLGESLANTVEVDLSKIPHLLLAGSTGSGKTVLLRLILMQCALKGFEVYIADFKGGVDFNKSWRRHTRIITESDDLTLCLNELVEELHRRKRLFAELDCTNIDEYNKRFGKQIQRIIFGCDEVAELLDKTGLDKKEKNTIALYEASIATIARLGRAFGIHLILATQRPDANIINGQIKNNVDFRACGRADNVLSQIILDKGDASDLISKTAQGRFLTNSDVLFQAYYFDDSKGW